MRNVKKMREILRLKFELQLSNRHIGKIVNTSPGVVSTYTSLFRKQGLGWTELQKKTDDELLKIFYDMNNFSIPQKKDFVEPDFKKIHQELKLKTVTLQLLWEEYRDIYGEKAYSRTQFCKMYKSWCKEQRKLPASTLL